MGAEILELLNKRIAEKRPIALCTVVKIAGSTPGKIGAMMLVDGTGIQGGTVGGGKIELAVIEKAKECLLRGRSENVEFQLNEKEGALMMACGGQTEVFIQVFLPDQKLLIAGGGHIGLELERMGRQLGFHTVVFDDREEFTSTERFPEANERIHGDFHESLSAYPVDDSCYIVIVTKGHMNDFDVLKKVIGRGARYIGMIGSRNKVRTTFDRLVSEKVDRALLDRVYAPCGLALGGGTPAEIALSIMAEIQMVKAGGSLEHMKDHKKTGPKDKKLSEKEDGCESTD